MRSSRFHSLVLSGLLIPAVALPVPAINLSTGWNLLGNSDPTAIDVVSALGDPATVKTVWKWNKTANRWAFYAPTMSAAELSNYAAKMGYDVLTRIDSKEGYWVNAAASLTSVATPPAVGGVTLTDADLVTGWSLVASADNKTPSQLNARLATSLTAANRAISTIWAWDTSAGTWKFYAPSLEAQGATVLSDYIAGKGYRPFTTAVSPTEGVWVNVTGTTTAATATTTTVGSTTTTTVTTGTTTGTTTGQASANGVTGKTLYGQYCASCHGPNFVNARNATLTLNAIATGRGGMGGLSVSIKAQQAADIAYYLTYGAVTSATGSTATTVGSVTTTTQTAATASGQALYNAYCASCHGVNFSSARSSSKTLSAIASGKGGMGGLSAVIQSTQAAAIASYLSSSTSGSSSGNKTEGNKTEGSEGGEGSKKSESGRE